MVRISGPLAGNISMGLLGAVPAARHASFSRFTDPAGNLLDEGIALYFPAPHSYTGEDVLELQAHGGPVVLHEILRCCVHLGARLAQPGEFTRRAFLNERLDLAQAEGVADLIDAASVEAARSAARSLSGEFSRRVHGLVEALLDLRAHVEACIDFPEDEIDPADRAAQRARLAFIRGELDRLGKVAKQGSLLREGLTVVLVGQPNVGKSSLLNRLAGEDIAIVTPIPGTTRDYVRATISLEGIPIHLIDTAGLRDTRDEVERIGVARTWAAIERAGAAMLITDVAQGPGSEDDRILGKMPAGLPRARVLNKIDLAGVQAGRESLGADAVIRLSALTGEGVDALRQWLLEVSGWQPHDEGLFTARARHLEALDEARLHLDAADNNSQAIELFAEEVRMAQQSLGRITGEVTADDLLGQIFSRFCIGK